MSAIRADILKMAELVAERHPDAASASVAASVNLIAFGILAERERVFEYLGAMADGWKANPGADDSGAIALSNAMYFLDRERAILRHARKINAP